MKLENNITSTENMGNIGNIEGVGSSESNESENIFTLKDIKTKLSEKSKLESVELDLGPNKVFKINKWSGKQILDYGNEIEKLENNYLDHKINDINIVQDIPKLIEKHLIKESVEGNYYFNDMEKLYLLVQIRKISLKKPLTITQVCPTCSASENVEISCNDLKENITKNRSGTLSLDNGISFNIGHIKNPSVMEAKSNENKIINEFCLRVNKVTYGNQSVDIIIFDELIDIITSLSNEDFNELIKKYLEDFAFSYSISQIDHVCKNEECKHISKIDVEDIMLIIDGI